MCVKVLIPSIKVKPHGGMTLSVHALAGLILASPQQHPEDKIQVPDSRDVIIAILIKGDLP